MAYRVIIYDGRFHFSLKSHPFKDAKAAKDWAEWVTWNDDWMTFEIVESD